MTPKTVHKIITGDSRRMSEVEDRSVHLVVTSPPYWQLKDYGSPDQIGFDDSYQDYINSLSLVWSECARVLHPGCRLCIDIGDQFARSAWYGRYKVIPIRTEITKFCESAGLDYMGAVIWQKVTTTNTSGGASIMGSYPFPRNGILKLDYEFILIFKKPGKAPAVSPELRQNSRLSAGEWNQYFSGHWKFPGEKKGGHLAAFPEELPRRLIRMFSFEGDTVLDPFLGSGTTTLAAGRLGRNSIGYEINEQFLPRIREKLGLTNLSLFQQSEYLFMKQPQAEYDFAGEIQRLPYVFTDPHGIARQADPKKNNYGSRVDSVSKPREKYYRVKEVLSPERLLLSEGLSVRLLGIREIARNKEEAVQFLMDKTRGQKVYLRYENIQYDDEGNHLCYLYLSNRTFINAHLLKKGLAGLDTGRDFRLKGRFESIITKNTGLSAR